MPVRAILLNLIAVMGFGMLLLGCSSTGDSVSDDPTWSYSGVVMDGSADSALEGAVVQYLNAQGDSQSVVTNSRGEFFIGSVPYGQRTFHFSCHKRALGDSGTLYGDRLVAASSYNESSTMPGALAGSARVVRMFPMTGAVKGELMVRVSGTGAVVPARKVALRMIYRDTTFLCRRAESFLATTDSAGSFRFDSLPADSGLQLSVARFSQDGHWYEASVTDVPRLLARGTTFLARVIATADSAADYQEPIAASNVLDAGGLGLSGIATGTVPWFRIAFPFDATRLDVQLRNGTAALGVVARVSGDTVFLQHSDPLPSDTLLTTEITGLDAKGIRFHVLLDGSRRFRTRKAMTAVESNAWSSSAAYRSSAGLQDTLWVRYSEALSKDSTRLQWSKSSAARTIYGRGVNANARCWVSAETLFVVPDQRLKVDTVGKMGFNVIATAASGSQAAAVDVAIDMASRSYSLKWTNTVNALGVMRDDFGTVAPVELLPDRSVAKVFGISAPDNAVLPPGIQPGDLSLHGDTVVYQPAMVMTPGTVYGIAVDLQSPDGTVFRKALAVRWKTSYQLAILSANNRSSGGYRRFLSLGDSLVVQFSRPVDTGKGVVVHMVDVKGAQVQTNVSWNAGRDVATIRNSTPLPTADFGVVASADSSGKGAKAVANVTFDLQSADGERITGLRMAYDSLRLFTEEGLCAVGSNVLKSHSSGYEVASTESVVDSFPVAGIVRVDFNRVLDTAWMRRTGDSTFANLQTSSGSVVAATIGYENGGRTLAIAPRAALVAGTNYNVQLLKVPALGIRNAAAISKSGGTYSGTTTSGFLVGSSFTAR